MKKVLFVLLYTSFFQTVTAQVPDTLITYKKTLSVKARSAEDIYDQTLSWCNQRLNDSKSMILTRDKKPGLISGKAYMRSLYKVPKNKDSVDSRTYTDYYFDWFIHVKDGGINIFINEIEVEVNGVRHLLKIIQDPPAGMWFTNREKAKTDFRMSKDYFTKKLDALFDDLEMNLGRKSEL